MVILYKGKLKNLQEELEKSQDKLNQRYIEVLGEDRAKKVKEIAERILIEESFFDDVEELSDYLGLKEQRIEKDTSNKMLLSTASDQASLEIDLEGRVKDKKIRTAPLFYISEDGFKHSGSAKFTENILASYIHEFNHFIFYALQKFQLH